MTPIQLYSIHDLEVITRRFINVKMIFVDKGSEILRLSTSLIYIEERMRKAHTINVQSSLRF
jgi:hypothetical protein